MSDNFKRRNRRTERLVVLLTPRENALLEEYFEAQEDFSSVSELIREFIRIGLQVTNKPARQPSENI